MMSAAINCGGGRKHQTSFWKTQAFFLSHGITARFYFDFKLQFQLQFLWRHRPQSGPADSWPYVILSLKDKPDSCGDPQLFYFTHVEYSAHWKHSGDVCSVRRDKSYWTKLSAVFLTSLLHISPPHTASSYSLSITIVTFNRWWKP